MRTALGIERQRHPFASGVTNISGNVQFILNEIPDSAWVVFGNGATNAITNAVVGTNMFALGTNKSFAIYCVKAGNGTATQISSDLGPFNTWNSPRGIGININPKNGSLFGRIYVDNSASASGAKGRGVFALNADQSTILGGTGGLLNSTFTNTTSTSSPYRIAVGADNNLYIGDFESVNAGVWQATPDLSAITEVFAGLGEAAGITAGVHGRTFGEPIVQGSIATSNMVMWVADASLPIGAGTTLGYGNGAVGGAVAGNVNNVDRYNIGAGPLPWTKPPDLSMNLGIAGIPTLDDDVDIGPITGNDFWDEFPRTITGCPVSRFSTPPDKNLLWSSLEGPINVGPDLLNPVFTNSAGTTIGPGCPSRPIAIKVSPDEKFVALGMINNPIFIMNLTNGVPDSLHALHHSQCPEHDGVREYPRPVAGMRETMSIPSVPARACCGSSPWA